MSLFGNNKNGSRNREGRRFTSTESARVNETTEVDLFVADDGAFWGLSRTNPNGGRSYRLLKPEQCRDAAEAVGFMASVFAKDPNCPIDLQSELSELSKRIEAVVSEVKAMARPNGATKPTGLLAAMAG
ncbi:hypothetical protein [Botrimarina mediterranea]|uniref:Uncharacterized protein n=1 Tax=Botrimarina mediterranea TaxID=2528022 RepID=A0A518K784_9BACT|nr:hypothetical protein [Botrimarina mediterranea]QDV73661.1 hypothetical protein Spa11_18600 [Botrimarina mediterranea]QDV78251.1 hypothetical protein K2D_18580 [Planctomycetes bacterium K2D]